MESLLSFNEQNAVRVNDDLRRLAQSLDTQIADGLGIAPYHCQGTSTEYAPPIRHDRPNPAPNGGRHLWSDIDARRDLQHYRSEEAAIAHFDITRHDHGQRHQASRPSIKALIRSIISGMTACLARTEPVKRRLTRSIFSDGRSVASLAALNAQGMVTLSR